MHITDVVNKVPYLKGLSEQSLECLKQYALERHYFKNSIILTEGEPCQGMWLVTEGCVRLYRMNLEGKQKTLGFVHPLQTFNEVPVCDGGLNPSHAEALTDVKTIFFPKEVLTHLIQQDRAFSIALLNYFSTRMRMLVEQIETLTLYDLIERMARYLILHKEVMNKIPRHSIANYLAITPESASRALYALERMGCVKMNRTRIDVLDDEKLRGIAQLWEPVS